MNKFIFLIAVGAAFNLNAPAFAEDSNLVRGVSALEMKKRGASDLAVLEQMRIRLKKGDALAYQYAEPRCHIMIESGPIEFRETNHNGVVIGSIFISQKPARKFIEETKMGQVGYYCARERVEHTQQNSKDESKAKKPS